MVGMNGAVELWRSISSTLGDVLEPREGEVVDASADAAREAERYTFSDPVGQLNVLADGIKERVESGAGHGLCR